VDSLDFSDYHVIQVGVKSSFMDIPAHEESPIHIGSTGREVHLREVLLTIDAIIQNHDEQPHFGLERFRLYLETPEELWKQEYFPEHDGMHNFLPCLQIELEQDGSSYRLELVAYPESKVTGEHEAKYEAALTQWYADTETQLRQIDGLSRFKWSHPREG